MNGRSEGVQKNLALVVTNMSKKRVGMTRLTWEKNHYASGSEDLQRKECFKLKFNVLSCLNIERSWSVLSKQYTIEMYAFIETMISMIF